MIHEPHEPRNTGARVLGEEREEREKREKRERRESVFTPLYAAGFRMCDGFIGKEGSPRDQNA